MIRSKLPFSDPDVCCDQQTVTRIDTRGFLFVAVGAKLKGQVSFVRMSFLQTVYEDKALLAATVCFGVIGALFTAAKTYSFVRMLLDMLVIPGISVSLHVWKAMSS